jgi:hypothetical protein
VRRRDSKHQIDLRCFATAATGAREVLDLAAESIGHKPMRRDAADATATVARGAGKSGLLATAGAQQRPVVGAVKGTSADLTAGTAAESKAKDQRSLMPAAAAGLKSPRPIFQNGRLLSAVSTFPLILRHF